MFKYIKVFVLSTNAVLFMVIGSILLPELFHGNLPEPLWLSYLFTFGCLVSSFASFSVGYDVLIKEE